MGAAILCLLLPIVAPAQDEETVQARPSGIPLGDSLLGVWRSSGPGRRGVFVDMVTDSTIMAHTPGYFFAQCYVDGRSLVGLARFNVEVEPEPRAWSRYQLMRATWVNATTLRITWISPISGTARAEETWTHVGSPTPTLFRPGPDSLPKFGELVFAEHLPEVVHRVTAHYPTWAREQGIQGTVGVRALVGKDGLVKDVIVEHSIPMLDPHAVDAVMKWRFKPAMSQGLPVAVWVGIPVTFTLE